MPRSSGGAARWHLLPQPYLWGLANTKKTEWEYTSYFFGKMYRHGPWTYFPAAFLIKSTLPLLILLGLVPFSMVPARRPARTRAVLCTRSSPVLLRVSHILAYGYRRTAPYADLPLSLLPGGSRCGACLDSRQSLGHCRCDTAALAGGHLVSGGAGIHGIRKTKHGAAPAEVHRYLSDANVDWGQQLKSVRQLPGPKPHHETAGSPTSPMVPSKPSDYGVPCKRLPTGSSLWWFRLPMEVSARHRGDSADQRQRPRGS